MAMQIRILAGPDMGKVFGLPLGKAVLLGRGKEADVQINDPSVSRAHCRLAPHGDEVYVEDLGSRSGLVLNGERVTEHPVKHLDVIQIGATQFRIEIKNPIEFNTVLPGQAPAPPAGVTRAKPVPPVTRAKPAAAPRGDKPPALPADKLEGLTGYRLGAYVIGPMLARGQSGPVFQATDSRTGETRALKVLWPDFARDDEEVKRFVRAMKTMLPVQHPHLVAICGAGKSAGYCWVAMEHVEGESLAQVMTRVGTANRLHWKDALRVATHVSRALVFAHHRRIIHRNITPQNILIRTQDGVAKLGDLMLSKALEGSLAEHITGKGELLGDLHYLAPERTSGLVSDVDERSDLYSLGAAVYAALTGKPPLQGKSMMETILKIRQEKPISPLTVQPGMPVEFEQIVMKLLAKTPDERFQSAAELLGVLQPLAKRLGVDV